MSFKFDKTIKASDVLTSLTIILSVIALVVTLTKDRDTRVREQANQVRTAAAKTLAKLERWQALQKSLYSELQPAYVETSEMLSKDFDVIKARDSLWKTINAQRVRISDRILSESIETAYVDLFAYYPSIRAKFLAAIAQLNESEDVATSKLLRDTQAAVMSFEGKKDGYSSAMLGNALRYAAAPVEKVFVQDTNTILKPIRDDLYALISSDDETILKKSKNTPK
jgi:hypothetical protein